MYMKDADLFEIDFYISYSLNCIYDMNINHRYKILFNLWVRINIYFINRHHYSHFDSGNIATRVKARNEKARRKTAHSNHNIWRLGNEAIRLLLSPPHTLLILISKVINVNERCRSIRNRFLHFLFFKLYIWNEY